MTAFHAPITLRGKHAQLEPLSREHIEPLCRAAADGDLHKLWYTSVPASDGMAAYVDKALAKQAEGAMLPFVVRSLTDGDIVGCTRYYDIDVANRGLAIGYTWYARSVQRSAINTECKWLLLRHAFDTLGCIVVTFHTHWHNQRSRAAIERLGAKQDGVLRNHRIQPDGSYRDTVCFSILESEWPAVQRNLEFLMQRGGNA